MSLPGTSGSLLSYQTVLDLDLVRVRVNTVQPTTPVRQTNIDELTKRHPALFKGIGKLKDMEVKLHIDKNVRPVTQPYRRVSFHLQKLVDSELMQMMDKNIIEKAHGPTEWLSPI